MLAGYFYYFGLAIHLAFVITFLVLLVEKFHQWLQSEQDDMWR